MYIRLWELGLFLVSIGFIIISIQAAYAIKSLDSFLKKATQILEESQDDIVETTANIKQISDHMNVVSRLLKVFTNIFENKDSEK